MHTNDYLKDFPMRIAINLIPYCRYSGIECFVENLLQELVKNSSIDFYVYYTSDLPFKISSERDNVFLRLVKKKMPLALYQQIILPFVLLRDNIDYIYSSSPVHPILCFNKNVVTIHDCAYHNYPREAANKARLFFIKIMYFFAIKFAKKVVSVSDFSAREIENEYKLKKNKVVNISASLPKLPKLPDGCNSLAKEKFDLQGRYLVFIGSSRPRKNLSTIVDAFDKIINAYNNNITLVIIGDLGRDQQLEKKLTILVESGTVRALGYVNQEDKVALLKGSIGLCFASKYEGFGLPLLEAQSLGVPVITGNKSAMPEVAGDAAIFVDPESVDDIANGMLKLINIKEKQRLDYRIKANKNINRFSWKLTAKKLADIFYS